MNTFRTTRDPEASAAAATSGVYTSDQHNPSSIGIGDLVPLTTIFTPSVWCSTRWLHSVSSDGQQVVLNHSPSGFKAGITSNYYGGCLPYDSTTKASFSPGVCPSGLEANALTLYTGGAARTWRAVCCSSGWYDDEGCRTTFTTPFTAITGYTESGTTYWDSSINSYLDTLETTTDPRGSVSVKSNMLISPILKVNRTVVTSGVASATPIIVAWQSSDLTVFPSDYASSLARRMGVDFATTTLASPGSSQSIPQATQTPPPASSTTPTQRPPLSTAAKAGIGVGATLFAVLVITAILATLLLRRRRKQGRKVVDGDEVELRSKAELPGEALNEADGNAMMPLEMEEGAPKEMDAASATALEMEAEGKGYMTLLLGSWRAEVDGDRPQAVELDAGSIKGNPRGRDELE
ncbi:hypothetical protein DM02DRAFT_669915 [Periconia macrospinosa]|uniref:Uncharacterized protein n=1 Tax=Periconia macrospinosa TaxID=97972 RepID=A0A2V1DYI5_9PLEO|nr:hypothetical protein DM02DRAFT_669915 [Periconia macrospinosa]